MQFRIAFEPLKPQIFPFRILPKSIRQLALQMTAYTLCPYDSSTSSYMHLLGLFLLNADQDLYHVSSPNMFLVLC